MRAPESATIGRPEKEGSSMAAMWRRAMVYLGLVDEPEDDEPMLLHEEEWMDLRAYRALKDAGATWAEIARKHL